MSARKRAERKAPQIIPPQQPIVFIPLTLSASIAFAREVDAQEQRYANRYGENGAAVGGLLGALIQQRGLRR